MLEYKKIAITGGIASGKSLFCHYLKELGAYVISADKIVHQLLSPKTATGQKVIKLLGPEILTDNEIDHKKVARKVFNDRELLQALEQILHPEVRKEITKNYEHFQLENPETPFFAEIPLLFESGMDEDFDATITISSTIENQKNRYKERGEGSLDDFELRNKRLLTNSEREKKATFTIYNNKSCSDLRSEAKKMFLNSNH